MRQLQSFVEQFTRTFDYSRVHNIDNRQYLVCAEPALFSKNISLQPFSIGLFLGESNSSFRASPALLDIISGCQRKAVVTKKNEWLFLCGRNVISKSATVREGYVLVENLRGEILGYGFLKNRLIQNLLDKGEYLRMER